ncbi:hypothetical protein N9D37_01510 [Erythrobacter sp.]|nr:hypothetical protein [Erythrobacter sp.]
MQIRLTRPAEKWFFIAVLPIAFGIEWAFAVTLDWSAYPRSEWVMLVDLCVFMPVIYLTLFASDLGLKARLLRACGVAGLGLFVTSFIVPDSNQFILSELSAIRNVLLVFVFLFEGWVFWKVIDAIYKKNADAKTLERDFAMPEWIAKLMVLEAKFWKAVWNFFGRK